MRSEVAERRAGRQRGDVIRSTRTFGEIAAEFMLAPDFKDLAPSTQDTYRGQLRRWVLPAFEHTPVADIDRRAVQNWVGTLRRCDLRRTGRDGRKTGLSGW
jgi:hypothetical protein